VRAALAPVVRSVRVHAAPPEAFAAFTERISTWWPLATHSVAVDEGLPTRAVGVIIEPFVGGRIYEVMADGGQATWGRVLDWRPPEAIRLSWSPNPARPVATEVEVRFLAVEEGTEVRLEHRGWERLGDVGARLREGYEQGWAPVLDGFAASVG
jgi:uncharacterized protein YndB with AHSA1/START domain